MGKNLLPLFLVNLNRNEDWNGRVIFLRLEGRNGYSRGGGKLMSGKTLDMGQMLDFNLKTINEEIIKTQAGNYALGYKKVNDDGTGTFIVQYVGRADSNVKGRLKNHLSETKYKKFKFSYATSPKSAFEKECKNYHDFECPDNSIHPDRPDGANWKCPVCAIFNN